jgi:hypothetical protein
MIRDWLARRIDRAIEFACTWPHHPDGMTRRERRQALATWNKVHGSLPDPAEAKRMKDAALRVFDARGDNPLPEIRPALRAATDYVIRKAQEEK